MSSDLEIMLILAGWSAAIYFLAFWRGVARAEAAAKADREQLLSDLDSAVNLIGSANQRPILRIVGDA